MILPRPAQCADWYEQAFGCVAVVMIDASAEAILDDYVGRTVKHDPLTTLRWISRPVGAAPRLLALKARGVTVLVLHHGADAMTGQVRIGPLADDDPSVGEQLSRLGLAPEPVARDDAIDEYALVGQEALASAMAFAVVAESDAPVEAPERPPPPDPDVLPLDIYASEFIGLATEFGAPLESVWHEMWEGSGIRWCLLNADLDIEDVERIPYRQPLPADDFLRALRACNEAGLHYLDLPVCVMTGPGGGHVIHIETIDDKEVVYHDPWPGRSLLAAGNNAFGIAARPWEGPARRWRITASELKRVAYASLVEPAVWLPLCGVAADVDYTKLSHSDFFSFFHLAEIGRIQDEETGLVEIGLQPGSWQQHIDLEVTVDADNAVRSAGLMIDRSWMSAPQTAILAYDLLTHFVDAVVTEADADEARLLCEAVRSIPTGGVTEVLSAGPPHLLNHYRLVAMTVAGVAPLARASLPCSTLRAFNGMPQSENQERTGLIVTVSRPRYEPGVIVEDHQTGYFMDENREFFWQETVAELKRLGIVSSGA